jgi:hypothetical protein
MPESTDLIWGSLIKPFIPGLWAMVIIFVAIVTASQLLADKLWRRSTDEVKLEETSSGASRYLITIFSAFCSQGKGRLYTEIIRHIMSHSLDNLSVIYVIDHTLSMTKL